MKLITQGTANSYLVTGRFLPEGEGRLHLGTEEEVFRFIKLWDLCRALPHHYAEGIGYFLLPEYQSAAQEWPDIENFFPLKETWGVVNELVLQYYDEDGEIHPARLQRD